MYKDQIETLQIIDKYFYHCMCLFVLPELKYIIFNHCKCLILLLNTGIHLYHNAMLYFFKNFILCCLLFVYQRKVEHDILYNYNEIHLDCRSTFQWRILVFVLC
jgi:hypothetical protein